MQALGRERWAIPGGILTMWGCIWSPNAGCEGDTDRRRDGVHGAEKHAGAVVTVEGGGQVACVWGRTRPGRRAYVRCSGRTRSEAMG